MNRLSIHHVGKTFAGLRGKPSTQARQPVSLEVADNDFITVPGPSGCGTSTLLRLIAGLETPTEGQILPDDQPVHGPDADCGVVFQSYTLLPWRTVRQTICFGLHEKHLPAAQQKEISDHYIAHARHYMAKTLVAFTEFAACLTEEIRVETLVSAEH